MNKRDHKLKLSVVAGNLGNLNTPNNIIKKCIADLYKTESEIGETSVYGSTRRIGDST